MKVGFARIDITPDTTVPLAGYFTLRERRSRRVRDPLFARAVVFDDGRRRAGLVALDLLLVPPQVADDARLRLRELGLDLIIHATHTHSSFGGIWDTLPARFSLGAPRSDLYTHLLDGIERAVRAAVADLAEATVGSGLETLASHVPNRRDPHGPRDEQLLLLRVDRPGSRGLVVSFAGHPVIVAERDFHAVSADFPGEIVRRIEQTGCDFCLYVNGPVGGVDVVFPKEKVSVEYNLELMAAPIVRAAVSAAGHIRTGTAGVVSAYRAFALPKVRMEPYHNDCRLQSLLMRPVNLAVETIFRTARSPEAGQHAFAVGEALFLGAPADLGVGIALDLRAHARDHGFAAPFIMSQCDGYIGYLHPPEEYMRTPSSDEHRTMARYENAMSIYGHGAGSLLAANSRTLIARLAADR